MTDNEIKKIIIKYGGIYGDRLYNTTNSKPISLSFSEKIHGSTTCIPINEITEDNIKNNLERMRNKWGDKMGNNATKMIRVEESFEDVAVWGFRLFMFCALSLLLVMQFINTKDIKEKLNNISRKENIGVITITATNPNVKGYNPKWYQLKSGECSISKDLTKMFIVSNDKNKIIGDTIEIDGVGVFIIKSEMGKYDNNHKEVLNTIDIYQDTIKDCMRFGRQKSRVYLIK